MLAALGGNSPFLADLAVREAASLRRCSPRAPTRSPPVRSPRSPRCRSPRGARWWRRPCATPSGWSRWSPQSPTLAASGSWSASPRRCPTWPRQRCGAPSCTCCAPRTTRRSSLPDPADPERGGGLTVLGMGKLGARELNYSSDIDLVLLCDPSADIYTPRSAGDALGAFRHGWHAAWSPLWNPATPTATSSAPICACGRTHP